MFDKDIYFYEKHVNYFANVYFIFLHYYRRNNDLLLLFDLKYNFRVK